MDAIPEFESPVVEKNDLPMFQTWIDAVTKPNTEDYQALAQANNANTKTAWKWIFIATLIGAVIAAIISSIFGVSAMSSLSGLMGDTGTQMPVTRTGFMSILTTVLCGAPIGALVGTLLFALGVALENWIANLLGGEGSFDAFAFVFAAFSAPISLATSVLSSIPFVGGLLGALIGIYSIYLSLLTLHAVKKLTWGKAVVVIIIPIILIGIFSGCILALLGPAIMATFQNIAQ